MRAIAELTQERIDQYVEQMVEAGERRETAEGLAENDVGWRYEHWNRAMPKRFRDARAEHLTGPLADAVSEWRDEPWRNLVLLGAIGVGKTYAAAAAARLAVLDGWKMAFWPVVDLLDALRPGSNDDGEATLERCKQIGLLVLDDLGAERPTDWTAERMYSLVNDRWLNERPIIVTSNLSARNGQGPFVDAVGPRMYSRLVDGAVVAQAAGEDRRRQ